MTKQEIIAELTKMLRLDDCPYWKHDNGAAELVCDDIEKLIKKLEENDNEVVFLYGWGQSCLDAKGMFPVSSVDEIDPSKHWVDIAKLSEDKEAYWLELVEQYGERQCK
jgi:hypothetical protein